MPCGFFLGGVGSKPVREGLGFAIFPALVRGDPPLGRRTPMMGRRIDALNASGFEGFCR